MYVAGPSGSGKSTFCYKFAEEYSTIFSTAAILVNLDCANENQNYHIDIRQLVTLDDLMEEYSIGYLSANSVPMRLCSTPLNCSMPTLNG